ncbi:MAG: hypothetical protein ACJ8C3_18985 [Microvirga sp.]
MITALILTDDGIEPLAATLAALVPAVAAGLVADAVVLDLDAASEIAAVADGVGAAHIRVAERRSAWAAGAAVARRDWLFCLHAGDVPQEGWIGAIEAHLGGASGPGRGRPRRGGALPARAAVLWERLAGARQVRAGDLVHRVLVLGPRLPRSLRPVRLDARIAAPRRPNRKQ